MTFVIQQFAITITQHADALDKFTLKSLQPYNIVATHIVMRRMFSQCPCPLLLHQMNAFVSFRKAQRYELWPRRRRTTRSSDSPAPTTTPGRSQTSRGNITSTSSRPFSPTSPASSQVQATRLLHSGGRHVRRCWMAGMTLLLSFPFLFTRFSSERVLHQIQTANFRIVTYLVSRPLCDGCVLT